MQAATARWLAESLGLRWRWRRLSGDRTPRDAPGWAIDAHRCGRGFGNSPEAPRVGEQVHLRSSGELGPDVVDLVDEVAQLVRHAPVVRYASPDAV